MRVGMFSDSYVPRISGVVRSVESFVTELRRQGHYAAIYAPGSAGFVDHDPDVVRFPSVRPPGIPDFPLAIPYRRRFIADIRARRLSIIHTHSPFLMGAVGRFGARAVRLPLVFTYHTMYAEYLHYLPVVSNRFSREAVTRFTILYCNRCQLVIAPSRAVRSFLMSKGVTAPIEVVPTAGLDLSRFAHRDPSWVRERYGIPRDTPLVISVGRLALEKRFDVLLAAFADAARRGTERLLLVGGGPQEDELRRVAARRGIAHQVAFSGPLPHDRVLDCYAAADMFAFASPTETQGMVVIEAMAAGLPVVAVRAGGVAETVRDGTTGLLVNADHRALGAAIRRMLDDPGLRRRCSEGGRRAAQAFAIDEVVHRLVELYGQAMRDAAVIAAPE